MTIQNDKFRTLVGSVKCCGVVGMLIKPQLTLVLLTFVYFSFEAYQLASSHLFLALLIEFLPRFLPRVSQNARVLGDHVIYFPPGTPCWEYPPNTKTHFFLNKNFSLKREYYMNVNTYRIVSTTVWTLQAKKIP